MREIFGLVGGIIAVSILLHYALAVFRRKAEAASIATWAMWTTLDVLLLATTWQTGKPVWLPLGWTIGATLVTVSLLRDGKWKWGAQETLSAVCATIATIIWLMNGAVVGVIAGTLAMTFAGMPILIEMVSNPIRSTFHVWLGTCVACILTLAGSDWSLAAIFLPLESIAYNGTMAYLVTRKPQEVHLNEI